MLKHVLLPLDGSQLAEEAVEYAKQVLPKGGRITLLTALNLQENWLYGADPLVIFTEYRHTLDQMEAAAKTYLERIAIGLRAEDFMVEALVQYGQPANIILDTAAAHRVDAIVMSTHGRSGISRWLFGSVTSKVLSTAACPVFVIPSRDLSRTVAEAAVENNYGG